MTARRAQHRRSAVFPALNDEGGVPPPSMKPGRRLLRRLRATARLLAITIWVPLSVGFEAILLLVPGTAKIRWTRVIWGVLCRLLSLDIRVIGTRAGSVGGARARARGERPVIYVSNHASWLDVPVLGTILPSVFVAKGDIGNWPIMGTVSRIGRTIFVSRQRSTTGRERDEMVGRLIGGDNLVLFPEGTSSDGSRVLPFMSAFFAIAKMPALRKGMDVDPPMLTYAPGMAPLIQPVSLVYDRLDGLNVNRVRRAVFSWYGDMDLAPHVWQLAQWRSMRATVLLHPALDPDDFPSRKALAQAAWNAVAGGAARLRQNADPQSLDTRNPDAPAPETEDRPAETQPAAMAAS
ncbi:1-acyl-sn-glycerol-3-phosphate acyltransferase [Gluconacetobacter azotocaptans DSM 13594]|nr:1-acyl-sn-glycerol-3-phosphate acyltransferase [Gluconacetobacter azotocaptans DSM 13594]